MRCLAVLDRIRDRSQAGPQEQHLQDNSTAFQPETQTETIGLSDTTVAPLAVDPTLQMFFEDTSWENDLFQGLNGFPATDEVDLFDNAQMIPDANELTN